MTRHPGTMSTAKKTAIATAVVILVVIAAVVVTLLVHGKDSDINAATTRKSTSSKSSSVGQADGANGCVGGDDPTTAISSAFNEPLTERGAVQFTSTVFRWMQDSNTTQEQLRNVGERLSSTTILDVFKDVPRNLPSDAHVGFSTKNSYAWVKSFDAKRGTANLVFTGKRTGHDSTRSVESEMATVVTLSSKDGHWFLENSDMGSYGKGEAGFSAAKNDARTHGAPLAGGCGE